MMEIRLRKRYTKRQIKHSQNIFKKEHGIVAKGYYPAIYMSIGMAIGVGIGVAIMSSMGTSFLAVGIGMGLAVGVGIGAQKEKKAQDNGLVY